MRLATGFGLVLALSLGAPAIVRAQDHPGASPHRCPTCGAELPNHRCPTCGQATRQPLSDEDRELDRVLRREYGDPNGPPPPAPPPPPPARPVKAPSSEEEEEVGVHLGLFAAHWSARLESASVSGARGSVHGDYLPLYGSTNSVANLNDWSQTQLFKAWIDLGPWLSIDGGANRAWFRDEGTLQRNFQFSGLQFTAGSALNTKFEFLTADLNLAVHAGHADFGHFDILLGFRYLWSNVEFTTGNAAAPAPGPVIVTGGGGPTFGPQPAPGPFFAPQAQNRVHQSVEAFLPMVGLGGAVRPVHTPNVALEFSARARVGGFEWEERYWDDTSSFNFQRKKYYAYSMELDAGASLVLFQMIGFTAGYHLDLSHVEREDGAGNTKRAEWTAHGPYAGVFVQF